MNSLNLPHIFTEVTEEDKKNIRGGSYINREYGMYNLKFKETVKIIENKGIEALSNTVLIGFFEQCLMYLNSSYNVNMELYSESEKYYDLSKSEILFRFNKKDLSKF